VKEKLAADCCIAMKKNSSISPAKIQLKPTNESDGLAKHINNPAYQVVYRTHQSTRLLFAMVTSFWGGCCPSEQKREAGYLFN
jgi:hypothetical protein